MASPRHRSRLAFIIGVLLWRAEPQRLRQGTAAAVHVLLGASNLLFWPLLGFAGMLVVGYVTTVLHGVFAALQCAAALGAQSRASKPA